MVNRAMLLVAMLAMTNAASGMAQDDPGSVGSQRPAKRLGAHVLRRPAPAGHLLSDFIKGSPAQQDLERRDNDLATTRPLDHRKDDFFSDWRGLR